MRQCWCFKSVTINQPRGSAESNGMLASSSQMIKATYPSIHLPTPSLSYRDWSCASPGWTTRKFALQNLAYALACEDTSNDGIDTEISAVLSTRRPQHAFHSEIHKFWLESRVLPIVTIRVPALHDPASQNALADSSLIAHICSSSGRRAMSRRTTYLGSGQRHGVQMPFCCCR